MRFLVALIGAGLGAGASALLYPLTHGPRRKLPELFGLATGCLIVDAWLWWVWRDDVCVWRVFTAQAVVGLGVAANRVRLEIAEMSRRE